MPSLILGMSTVQHIAIESCHPEDHLIRTVNIVAKMGFQLHGVLLRPSRFLPATIEIGFVRKGNLGAHTLLERIAQMPGVECVRQLTAAESGFNQMDASRADA